MKDLQAFVAKGRAMQRDVDKILEQPEGKVRQEFTDLVRIALERKRRLDKVDRDNSKAMELVEYDRWLVDAVELLLQIELERRHQGRALETKP